MTARVRQIQSLLDLFPAPRYLELGVFEGVTFQGLRAAEKVGVDPEFSFDVSAVDATSTLHAVTSDEYFATSVGPDIRFDVVFLDGLHSFEQTLRDLMNALAVTGEQGIVVVDDVYPSSPHAAVETYDRFRAVRSALALESGAWMGDVYRLVFFVETFLPELTYRTAPGDLGRAVLWRQRRTSVPERSVEEIARLTYHDAVLARDHYHVRPWAEIQAEVAAALGLG